MVDIVTMMNHPVPGGMPMQGGPMHHGPMQGPPGAGPPGPPPGAMRPGPGHPQQPQQPHQPPSRPDDVGRLAKSRDLIPVLHEKWNEALKEGGVALSVAGSDTPATSAIHNKFETSMEDFFSTLDQIELNLKCAGETSGQSQATSRYMMGNLNYHQHISSAKHQVSFTNQIRDMLRQSAQDIVDHSVSNAPQQPQQQPVSQQQQQQPSQ